MCLQKAYLRLYSSGTECFQNSLSSIVFPLVKAGFVSSDENWYHSSLSSLLWVVLVRPCEVVGSISRPLGQHNAVGYLLCRCMHLPRY